VGIPQKVFKIRG